MGRNKGSLNKSAADIEHDICRLQLKLEAVKKKEAAKKKEKEEKTLLTFPGLVHGRLQRTYGISHAVWNITRLGAS